MARTRTSTNDHPAIATLMETAAATSNPIVADLLRSMTPLDLLRVISLNEAARVTGLSRWTLAKRHSGKIVRISEARIGIRMADVLAITLAAAPVAA
jgi:hypothetical protein